MFNTASWAEEQMDGIDFLFFVRRLAEEMEHDWPGVLAKLELVKALLINRSRLVADVTLDGANWAQLQPQVTAFLQALPLGDAAPRARGWQQTLASQRRRPGHPRPDQLRGQGRQPVRVGLHLPRVDPGHHQLRPHGLAVGPGAGQGWRLWGLLLLWQTVGALHLPLLSGSQPGQHPGRLRRRPPLSCARLRSTRAS